MLIDKVPTFLLGKLILLGVFSLLISAPVLAGLASASEGIMVYHNGDHTKALELLLLPAKEGDIDAQNYIGLIFAKGKGPERNDEKAVYWFKKAISLGSKEAERNLEFLVANGRTGIGTEDPDPEDDGCD